MLLEPNKVHATCRCAGGNPAMAERKVQYIAETAYDGIKARQIYELVSAALAGATDLPEVKH